MNVERGDVLWSGDPFKDDAEAGRPWLVVNTDRQPFADEQSMVVALSTSGHDAAVLVRDDEWVSGSVPHRSYALPWAVHSVRHDRTDNRIGRLKRQFVDEVVSELCGIVLPSY